MATTLVTSSCAAEFGAQQFAVSLGDPPGSPIDAVLAQVLRIEQASVAGEIGAVQALEAVLTAVASLTGVSGCEAAIYAAGSFDSIASRGLARLENPKQQLEAYLACMASGRMQRWKPTDPQESDETHVLIMPLFARGGAIGVLGVVSNQAGLFTYDYIVPLATAATICSALAHRAQEDAEAKAGVAPVDPTMQGSDPLSVAAPETEFEPVHKRDGEYDPAPLPFGQELPHNSGLGQKSATDHGAGCAEKGPEEDEDLRCLLLPDGSTLADPQSAAPVLTAAAPVASLWRSKVMLFLFLLMLSGLILGILKFAA